MKWLDAAVLASASRTATMLLHKFAVHLCKHAKMYKGRSRSNHLTISCIKI